MQPIGKVISQMLNSDLTGRCMLCGGPPTTLGMFRPDNPQAFGAAPGKARLVFYSLCAQCAEDENSPGKIEKNLLAEMQNPMQARRTIQ